MDDFVVNDSNLRECIREVVDYLIDEPEDFQDDVVDSYTDTFMFIIEEYLKNEKKKN